MQPILILSQAFLLCSVWKVSTFPKGEMNQGESLDINANNREQQQSHNLATNTSVPSRNSV